MGRENVFMDFDSIPYFTRFEDFIKFKIAESDIIVLMIGPRWLEHIRQREAKGEPDFVRIEIVEALRLKKPIAPIAIQGAQVPDAKDVPPDLRPLFALNIAEIKQGRDLLNNIDGLMASLDALLPNSDHTPPPFKPPAAPSAAPKPPALDDLMRRFADAYKGNDLPLALLLLEEMRVRGGVPEFFKLDERTQELQTRLREAEEAQRRREVAEYLYGVVRTMVELQDPPAAIRAALQEVWKVEKGYDPDQIAAGLPKSPPRVEESPSKAVPRQASVTPPAPPTPRPLRAIYPLDWVRLYVWLFFQPAKLLDHREHFGRNAENRVGAWLSATLALLPLFIPTLAAVAGVIPWQPSGVFTTPEIAMGTVFAVWAVMVLLSLIPLFTDNVWVEWLNFVVTIGVAVAVTGGVSFGAAGVVAVAMMSSLAGGVSGGVSRAIAVGATVGVVGGVIGAGVGSLAIGLAGGVAGVLTGVTAFVVAVVVADSVSGQLHNGARSPNGWQIVIGLLTPLCYAVLIAVFWFGVALP